MTPKIPKGWRRLRKGVLVRKGDKIYSDVFNRWYYVSVSIGRKVDGKAIWVRRVTKCTRHRANCVTAADSAAERNPMRNDHEKYSVKCPNCFSEHCFPTLKEVNRFTKGWDRPSRFSQLCAKPGNRRLILKELECAEVYHTRRIWESATRQETRHWITRRRHIITLRAQLLEAK